jgi:hypothetical protein
MYFRLPDFKECAYTYESKSLTRDLFSVVAELRAWSLCGDGSSENICDCRFSTLVIAHFIPAKIYNKLTDSLGYLW